MSKMDATLKTEWLTALRSGEYKQTEGYLKANLEDGGVGYCCLGVLCDVLVKRGEFGDGLTMQWDDMEEDPDHSPHEFSALTVLDKDGREVDKMAGSLPYQVESAFNVCASIVAPGGYDEAEEEFPPIKYFNSDGVEDEAYGLIDLNDSAGYTFEQIADVIEERF